MRQRSALFLLTILALAALPLAAQRAREEFALILQDPPVAATVASRKDLNTAAADDRRSAIQAKQTELRTELESRGFQVTASVQTLLNAVFVRASQDRVEELRGLTGVKRVASSPPAKLHMDRAGGLVKAPQAWSRISGGAGNAGAGVKIGIIDTGIDQTHPAFQDSSLVTPPGFPKCVGDDCDYVTNKVIAARSYVHILAAGSPANPASDSRPDDLSPRDRVGHGTANAMIAAGVTNTAPNGITITGIAPKAFLGNYKIFGSPGLLDYTFGSAIIEALDDAFLDGMDIVSLSFGSPAVYGPLDRGAACDLTGNPNTICDIRADAVQNAMNGGMVVVASSGNDGDIGVRYPTLNTIATPGTAPAAITVGGTTNSHILSNRLLLPGAGGQLDQVVAYLGDGPKPAQPLTAPLRDVQTLGNDGLACSALAAGSLTGAFALVRRGTCNFADKVNNAYGAGAVGVVIYMFDDEFLAPAGLIATAIPAMTIDNISGDALRTFLATHPDYSATMDPSWTAVDASFDDVAPFSSRGPSIGAFGIKPELVAVGTDVFTATQNYDPNSDMYDASRYAAFSGTSFAVPMVAGAAALVKQRNPTATTADIKSAVVNTASTGIGDPPFDADILAVGAGKLDAEAAVLTTVSAEPATLSFGNVTTIWPPTPLKLKLKNLGATPVHLDLNAPAPLTLSQNPVDLNPGATTEISVGLSGAAPSAGSYQGVVTIMGGAVPLRVPYLYMRAAVQPVVDNLIPLYGDGFMDIVGGFFPYSAQFAIKLLDQYGIPVSNVPVVFLPVQGGGSIYSGDAVSDIYGLAAANFRSGFIPGEQIFAAIAGGLYWPFFYGTAIPIPTINANGGVNSASGEIGQGLAPISYMSIYGSGLSPVSLGFRTPYLPLALAGVSVSFDAPPLSLPGRVHYVSQNQINVEIPREFLGLNSVKMKVSIGDISTPVYTVPLNNYSPALFQHPISSGYAVALWNGSIVSSTNRVPRGQEVQLYVNGLGPVNQVIETGEPTQASPPVETTATPTVTFGGVPGQVGFHGLIPGAIGVYRIDVTVPAGAPADPDVIVTNGGVSSKAVKLWVQ